MLVQGSAGQPIVIDESSFQPAQNQEPGRPYSLENFTARYAPYRQFN
jgi:hypothetical protein